MTDLEIYDRAMYTYLSSISDRVIYSITSKAFQNMAKNSTYRDYIKYNMISYFRRPSIEIDSSRYNFTATTVGDFTRLREVDKKREARYVQSLPVNLNYQIDIWAPKEASVQESAIKLISKIYMQNQILVAPMNPDGEPARFHITNVDWEDNSDLEEENEKGRLYRHTVSIIIEAQIKLTRDVMTEQFQCSDVDIYNDKE